MIVTVAQISCAGGILPFSLRGKVEAVDARMSAKRSENAVVSTVGHSYEGTVTKEPTCTEYGAMSYVCSVCGATTAEAIAKTPHNYQKTFAEKSYISWLNDVFSGVVWGKADGVYWYYICADCGKIQTGNYAAVASAGAGHRHEYAVTAENGRPNGVVCPLCGEQHLFVKGDLNGDKLISISDVTALLDYLSADNAYDFAYDIDDNGSVSISDVTALLDYLATY